MNRAIVATPSLQASLLKGQHRQYFGIHNEPNEVQVKDSYLNS
jgi:hypothetical protein